MIFVEVVVNVPVRRSFTQHEQNAPPAEEVTESAESVQLQTFHYHLPAQLEGQVHPGQLIWAPFGRQQVQGVVVRMDDHAPVPTKPVTRLARPEPVLTATQLELAMWIANYYVAPFSEAIKLFLPPGLLQKHEDSDTVRVKREWQVDLIVEREQMSERLLTLGRNTNAAAVLAWLLAQPGTAGASSDLSGVVSKAALSKSLALLIADGTVSVSGGQVALAVSPTVARDRLLDLRGIARHAAVLHVLQTAEAPMWVSDLRAQITVDLPMLRQLEQHGLVRLDQRVRFRDPLGGRTYAHTTAPRFTAQQEQVWQTISEQGFAVLTQEPPPRTAPQFLLHGVTGSGKTEIYLRLIAETLARGRQAIVLVPEIALTPQTVARFAGRFPGRVTVIHSELSRGERYDVWRALRDGDFDVVIGPRSALFAPLRRLGAIIIDEEHESSYKQDSEEWGSFAISYDARTIAAQLADLSGSPLIMGSATPSLEAYTAAVRGEMILLEMPRRILGHGSVVEGETTLYAELPPVEIVDMRQELRAGNRSIFSRSLQAELHATLDAGEQAILFLNRRGANTFVLCRDCGHVEECSRCSVPLVYHERAGRLLCHHCGRDYPLPVICPDCKSKRIRYFGAGTEQIEALVQEIDPRARLLRWDADTTARKGSHDEILQRFARHEANVLVGTQMIAKGLDLPMVTLVGVIAADVGLHLPDFRSGERTFQLLTQVAGRAGRSKRGGRVVIQTYTPQHYAIQAAAQHDYAAFYRREMQFRQEQGYPPVRRMARLVYWHQKPDKAKAAAQQMAATLQRLLAESGVAGSMASLLGPAPAFFERTRGYYRWHLLLRAQDPAFWLRRIDFPFGWRVDIDPVSVL